MANASITPPASPSRLRPQLPGASEIEDYDGDLTTYFEYSIDQTLTNALYSSANFGEYGALTATSSLGNQIYNDPLDAFNLSSGMQWDMTIVAVPY